MYTILWDTMYTVSDYLITFKLIDGMQTVVLMVSTVNITIPWDVILSSLADRCQCVVCSSVDRVLKKERNCEMLCDVFV